MGHAVQWYLETWAPCHSPWKFTIQVSTCPRQTKPGALLRSEAERWLGDPPPGQDALSQRLLSDVSAQPAQIALSEMPARSRAWHHQNRSAPGRCGHQPVPVFSLAQDAQMKRPVRARAHTTVARLKLPGNENAATAQRDKD